MKLMRPCLLVDEMMKFGRDIYYHRVTHTFSNLCTFQGISGAESKECGLVRVYIMKPRGVEMKFRHHIHARYLLNNITKYIQS